MSDEKPNVDPREVRLYYQPHDSLRMTVGEDRSYPIVKPVWAAPLSHPGRYLSLLDAKGDEIMIVENPSSLDHESQSAVMEELRRRNITAEVKQVLSVKVEFGSTYWKVNTDKGARDFVCQSLQENAQWFDDHHLMLIDVDGNRFEIVDIQKLDVESKAMLAKVI